MKLNNRKAAIKRAGTLAVLLCGMSTNAYAASDSAIITITGRVLANTCTVDSASANQNIVLPDIADRDIAGTGKTGGEKEVNIILKDCGGDAGSVVVTVTGNQDPLDDSAFANAIPAGNNSADGVALYFMQTDGVTKFSPSGSVQETSILTPAQDNTLVYKASYVGTKDTVTAGNFSTVVNMQFAYQ